MPGRKWTEEEIDFLKENYENMTYEEMGEKLDRSKPSVGGKARSLGLKKVNQRHGYWSKEKVIEEIQELATQKEEPPKYTDDRALASAAEKHFNSWNDALKKAGFEPRSTKKKWTDEEIKFLKENYQDMTYREIAKELNRSAPVVGQKARELELQKLEMKPSGYWDKETIIEKIKEFAEEYGKEYITASNLSEEEPGLIGASRRLFDSFKEVLNEAGFDYEKITGEKAKGYWTKERVIKEIKKCVEEHGKEYLINLRDKRPDISGGINNNFESLSSTIEAAGFDYEEITGHKPRNYWNEENIINKLQILADKYGKEYLRYNNLRENEPSVLSSAQVYFGSLHKAVEKAGFDFEEITGNKPKGFWTKERIVEKLREIAKNEGKEKLNITTLRDKYPKLAHSAQNKFESYKAAIEEAGFDYYEISQLKREYWTKEKILNRLNELSKKFGKDYLHYTNIQFAHPDLFSAAQKRFDYSYKLAVESAGFSYEDIKRPSFGERVKWYGWEECCKGISNLLFDSGEILFKERLEETRLEPDLQIPDENLIVDAKLNARDRKGISRDIDSYLNYCDRLEFWCLEGERDIVPEDVEIVGSEELLERLEENGLSEEEIEEFEKKMEMIRRGINPYEESQEELDEF